jgi:hypothetical protein
VDLTPLGFDKRRAALIVLGAGATRGASFVADASVLQPPLDGDFFLQLRACDLAQEQDGQALLEFVDAEFGESDPSMEAFYSQVYLHDQFVADLPKGKGRRRRYEWAMQRFLRLIPPLFNATIPDANCRWHDALVGSLDASDAIVSFNYDCVVDRSLRDVAKRKWDSRVGYGVAASGAVDAWIDHSGTGRFVKEGHRLLKLHGSLNWRLDGQQRLELVDDPYARRAADELCIIPPLWQKSFENPPFHDLWISSRALLTTRKALLFIGYSLPATDVYTQAMLRIDVPELDFLLIANPDSEARARLKRVLQSALKSSTRVVELERMSDVGTILAAALPTANTTAQPAPAFQ